MSTELTLCLAGVRLSERLGAGASSSVWRGHSAALGEVAVKIGRSAEQCSLFAGEAERLLAVASPHIVRLLDAGVVREPLALGEYTPEPGAPFLVLEAARGVALRDVFGAHECQPELALAVARDIGSALEELHATGFAHGDVKPDNIVVHCSEQHGWQAQLVDFGLALRTEQSEASSGTWRYLGPELTAGGDARARDIWALGLTLAEIVSERVRESKTPAELLAGERWPAALASIIPPLLRPASTRPTPAWLHRRAFFALGGGRNTPAEQERRRCAVQSSYLAVRRSEFLEAATYRVEVAGAPAVWLRERVRLQERVQALSCDGSMQSDASARSRTLGDLDEFGRCQWLSRLIGPQATRFAALKLRSDGELAQRLLELCAAVEPESFTLPAIEDNAPMAAEPAADSPIALALALGAGAADGALLARAEHYVHEHSAPEELLLGLGRALRLRGELARALLIFERAGSPLARIEAAETARRAGDRPLAERWLA
ncbi:MAG TPA: protein kinase, partial [Polyangiaceae bacterium]|nr:protein kinase [Polyangiaceae bacterium]